MSEFSEKLANKRKSKNMLRNDAAKYFGWTPMYYGRYESGRLVPGKFNYEVFSSFLEITIDELKEILERDIAKYKHNEHI